MNGQAEIIGQGISEEVQVGQQEEAAVAVVVLHRQLDLLGLQQKIARGRVWICGRPLCRHAVTSL